MTKVGFLDDIYHLTDSRVEVSYLKYPVFCLRLSTVEDELDLLWQALKATLDAIGEAPFNLGFLNREMEQDTGPVRCVEVFVFARSKERSMVLPSLKLGISEMMGVFHAQSNEELELLVSEVANTQDAQVGQGGQMAQALKEVSFEDRTTLWNSIKDSLANLGRRVASEVKAHSTSNTLKWFRVSGLGFN